MIWLATENSFDVFEFRIGEPKGSVQGFRCATHASKLLGIRCDMTIIFDNYYVNKKEINSFEISLYVIQLDNKK